jgi:hypothetical protein
MQIAVRTKSAAVAQIFETPFIHGDFIYSLTGDNSKYMNPDAYRILLLTWTVEWYHLSTDEQLEHVKAFIVENWTDLPKD